MPLFFFHLHDGVDQLLDEEGIELIDLETVKSQSLREARSLMAHEVLEGRLNIGQRLDIRDAAGELVHSLEFKDALRVQNEE